MSLDWSVGKVREWKTKCYTKSVDERGKEVSALTNDCYSLVMGSMHLGLGSIRANNVDEWVWRIEFCRRMNLGWMSYFDESDEGDEVKSYYPSAQAVVDHIGLRTNVSNETRVKWRNRMLRSIEREVNQLATDEMSEVNH